MGEARQRRPAREMELIPLATKGEFTLYERTNLSTPEWWSVRLVRRTPERPCKTVWVFGWNGERLARNHDSEDLPTRYPDVHNWVLNILASVPTGQWNARDVAHKADDDVRTEAPEKASPPKRQPNPVDDLKPPPRYYATNEVRCRGQRLSRILWQGWQWAVTVHGIERRDGAYAIRKDRLGEEFWVARMREKEWCRIGDFTEALRIARGIFAGNAREKKPNHLLR